MTVIALTDLEARRAAFATLFATNEHATPLDLLPISVARLEALAGGAPDAVLGLDLPSSAYLFRNAIQAHHDEQGTHPAGWVVSDAEAVSWVAFATLEEMDGCDDGRARALARDGVTALLNSVPTERLGDWVRGQLGGIDDYGHSCEVACDVTPGSIAEQLRIVADGELWGYAVEGLEETGLTIEAEAICHEVALNAARDTLYHLRNGARAWLREESNRVSTYAATLFAYAETEDDAAAASDLIALASYLVGLADGISNA